jgi:hypothetical protein
MCEFPARNARVLKSCGSLEEKAQGGGQIENAENPFFHSGNAENPFFHSASAEIPFFRSEYADGPFCLPEMRMPARRPFPSCTDSEGESESRRS